MYKTAKLMAMSRIARDLAPALGLRYAAGHWLKHMPWSLLWQTKPHSGVNRIGDYVAPSWSWTSIDGEIFYEEQKGIDKTAGLAVEINEPIIIEQMTYMYETPFSDKLESLGPFPKPVPDPACVVVLGVDVNLVNKTDPFGQITSGVLHLSGKLVTLHVELDGSKEKILHVTINDSLDLFPDPESRSPEISLISFEPADMSHLDEDHPYEAKEKKEIRKMVQDSKATFFLRTKQADLLLDEENALTQGARSACDTQVGVISVSKNLFFLPVTQKTPDDPMIGLLLMPKSSGSFVRLGIMKVEKKIAEMFSSVSNRETHIV
ncbi:hypothetical protein PtrSN002B_006983 [Pyrenophora tritici-repentis]|uniref:Uncharacterized protein n=1 Tax=Pyrenophora tritici-repentis TaxID=45151 RepID=A0A2W1EMM3_9PLEO|nr:hypothetical protein PtrV1_01953 [Pyrenophora tritici-repentis]KAF7454684.1 hypothetical protein A1F99_019420 [Pyrenophora tritici-repentis]KAF7577814.1 hypothetical protein PtrM4_020540 [Pyrenophora tritici-repentis]KAG9388440.1 hypothetical protein A1F94_001332 [Pyrenophora tritici-repentis]KAI0575776.1 hypothetical protein Alg215_07819 [Pyrenophora tritici-repentis]